MAVATKVKVDWDLKKIQLLGFTEEVNECECCGKSDLKGTIVIENLESGSIMHFGVVCAAKADKYATLEAVNLSKKNINSLKNRLKALEENSYRHAHFVHKALRGTEGYVDLIENTARQYRDERIEQVNFEALNHEQIQADMILAKSEFRNSEEYISHDAFVSESWEKIKDDKMTREEYFAELRSKYSPAKDLKMKEILAKYPSLKYWKNIG